MSHKEQFSREDIPTVVESILEFYVETRSPEEAFIDVVNRVGVAAFKERVYANN